MRPTLVLSLVLPLLPLTGVIAEEPRPAFLGPVQVSREALVVPATVAPIIRAAENESDPEKALDLLKAYHGEDVAVIDLLMGQEELLVADRYPADQHRHLLAAETNFERAEKSDPHLEEARLGEAQVAAELQNWTKALALAGPAINPANASQWLYYATICSRAGDWELANEVTVQGLMRFPTSRGFRQLHLELLLHAHRMEEAEAVAQEQLSFEPGSTDLWTTLASIEQECNHPALELVALEAASICSPSNVSLQVRLGIAQLSQGISVTAFETAQRLLGAHPPPAIVADLTVMTFAIQAASAAGDPDRARTWLTSIPEAHRTRDVRLLEAQLAIQTHDLLAADTVLTSLITLGEHDPRILTWAASIAEQRGDTARAEAEYQQASTGSGEDADNAVLHLAVLYFRHDRLDEARQQASIYLAKHPGDVSAEKIVSLIDNRRSRSASR
jgi:tetratricopeptide (TPR) repeat protein